MAHTWDPLCPRPRQLVRPVRLDPQGLAGPTPGQARGPRWRQCCHGWYVPSDVSAALAEQRILEQSVRLGDTGAVTGWASLRLHGAGFFDEMRRTRDVREAVVAMDLAAAALLVSVGQMREYREQHRSSRRAVLVGTALDLASEHSRSPQESRLRLVWQLDAGLPRPLVNQPVWDREGRMLGIATCSTRRPAWSASSTARTTSPPSGARRQQTLDEYLCEQRVLREMQHGAS